MKLLSNCRGATAVSITVAQAMKIGGLREGRVLAGKQNLENIVENVNVLEVFLEKD